eukprot:2639260-Amphidinium_carterae.1
MVKRGCSSRSGGQQGCDVALHQKSLAIQKKSAIVPQGSNDPTPPTTASEEEGDELTQSMTTSSPMP